MAGTITHKWNGTVLTITSDSGTSSMDLKGATGDEGCRGPQGPAGEGLPGPAGPAGEAGPVPVKGVDYYTETDKIYFVNEVKKAIFKFDSSTGRLDITV